MEKGLAQAAALRGGWAAWQRAGYPVASTPAARGTATAIAAFENEQLGAIGDRSAPVTILEFSDYQCPHCRRHVLQTYPQIKEIYIDSGRVRYVFKDFPLPAHANAQKAAEAARCAGAQAAFWSMHDRIFESQREWSPLNEKQALDAFLSYAEDLELDSATLAECLETGQFVEQIAAHVQEGRLVGVGGTPWFLINDQVLPGAYPFEAFQQIIEEELSTSR